MLPRASEVTPVEVLRFPSYAEGIVFDRDGSGYVSHGKSITRFSADGRTAVWAEADSPKGHKILLDGTHLVCDWGAVLRFDRGGARMAPASTGCNGKPLRKPNDLAVDPGEGFYFTDPEGSMHLPTGTIHYVDREGRTHLAADSLMFPNGIILRPGGKILLVAESGLNRILQFPVKQPGKLGPSKVFANLPAKGDSQMDNQPDGMCLDAAGNLYVAHYGMRQVQVLDPAGRLIRTFPSGALRTSNVAFAGPAMDTLYVTGGIDANLDGMGALFRLYMPGVKGLTLLPVDPRRGGERIP